MLGGFCSTQNWVVHKLSHAIGICKGIIKTIIYNRNTANESSKWYAFYHLHDCKRLLALKSTKNQWFIQKLTLAGDFSFRMRDDNGKALGIQVWHDKIKIISKWRRPHYQSTEPISIQSVKTKHLEGTFKFCTFQATGRICGWIEQIPQLTMRVILNSFCTLHCATYSNYTKW